jgi:cardiolipin synthase
MLEAIRSARRSINLECYIFHPGRTADRFIAALTERAAAGVPVNIVLDAYGSREFRPHLPRLQVAGCRVEWHQQRLWRQLVNLSNRTHREILVVDGRVAFTGGAGVSDWWSDPLKCSRPWRDMMVRVEGPIVASIQSVFAENWLQCHGEILSGDEYFPRLEPVGQSSGFIVRSLPSAAASRVLLQTAIACAGREIRLATPYLLPDRYLTDALVERARGGVSIALLVPGECQDHPTVRIGSRRLLRPLLEAGIRVYEYQPTMLHQKLLVVDGLWSIVGTSNVDNLSFEHLDEINLAVLDRQVAAGLAARFDADLRESVLVTLESWRRRPLWEKAAGQILWVLAGYGWTRD